MPKLPEFICDRHKRYKEDTNRLTSWLIEAAKELGYDVDLKPLSTESPQTNPPRKNARSKGKGKARKQQSSNATASRVTQCRRILVKEFARIANFIADSAHLVKVPSPVLKLARRAIAARKRCAEWYRQQTTNAEDDISTKTHQHFITALEEVVQILEPLSDQPDTTQSPPSNETPQEGTSSNRFSLLSIEERRDEDLWETLVPPMAATVTSITVPTRRDTGGQLDFYYIVEGEDEAEEEDGDILFALFCFFEDLRSIRDFLRDTWSEYRDKKIDLITASVTTNMSFEIIRKQQEDLLALHPDLDSYKKIAMVLCVREIMRPRVNRSTMVLEVDLDAILNTPRRKQVEEFVYIPVYSFLMSLLEVVHPDQVPVYRPGHYGIYNPGQSRDSMSADQKELEDHIILSEMFPDFLSLARLKSKRPVQDELSKELEKMIFDKEISLLLVFAVQVFLDIHHVLRDQISQGFEDLRSAGVWMATSFRLRAQQGPKVRFENWPASNETPVEMLNWYIKEWILKDYLGNFKKPIIDEVLGPSAPSEAYYLLSRHPLFCGMLQFRLQLMFQETGLALATAWGTILFVGHLYEAGKHAGFLRQGSWKDMEWVMKVHDKERMFRGRIPRNVTESFKSLCLMAGASTASFASSSRANKKNYTRYKPKLSPKGPSFLKENSPVSAMFREMVVQGGAALTVKTMEDLLGDCGVDPTSLQVLRPQTKLQQQWAQTHKIGPLEFLFALRTALVAEQHMIRFDYVGLHMRCIRLLREIRVTLHDTFMKRVGEGYMDNETQLSWLVGWILQSAVESKVVTMTSQQRAFIMLQPASQVVEDFIEREGGVECSKLEKILPQTNSHLWMSQTKF